MFTIDMLTEFLGWATVINFSILVLAALMLVMMRNSIISIHGKMFSLDSTDLLRAYFQYLAQYKIAIFVLNLAPYIALKIMA